jgi:hypothetical protein
MQLTQKLLSYIHSVFNKNAQNFSALQIATSGSSMTWTLADGVLTLVGYGVSVGDVFSGAFQYNGAITYSGSQTTTVTITINTAGLTLAQLAEQIDGTPNFYLLREDVLHGALSCSMLVDGSGSSANPIYGSTNLLYQYLDAVSSELQNAKNQIPGAIAEIYLNQADGSWLDVFGSYFNILRLVNEQDAQYQARMIFYVTQPMQNNVAIANALATLGGVANVSIIESASITAPQQTTAIQASIAANQNGRFPGAPRWWRIGANSPGSNGAISYSAPTYDFRGVITLPPLNNLFELSGSFSYPSTSIAGAHYDGTRTYGSGNYYGWTAQQYIDAMSQTLDPQYAAALFWDIIGRYRAAGTSLRKRTPVLPITSEAISTSSSAQIVITDSSTSTSTTVTLADNAALPPS